MNGYKVIEDAARLTGIEQIEEHLKIIGLPLVNAILEELDLTELASLSDEVGALQPSVRQALLFGVAMLICNATGNEEGRYAMSQIYSLKLSGIKGRTQRVRDVMPRGGLS